ncbi:hypothetical protein [Sideroxydans sp. CL21]|uniref:hypothetical protein n=1 Tax=Sideroxydans sp. CL21 TaxID=2600596 RepID=UPI0012A8EA2E|nr:hypothetical protein [Sideroxydans sp. CL21]VVC82515.1 hypothetical protein [Sideroxydans sp. CL21]
MAKKQYKNAAYKRDSGGYVAIPFSVLNSVAYLGLGSHARMLLFDLAAQYRGNNNGNLCAAWKLMHPRGWKSEDTLNKAKRGLLESGLIVETRKGARPNKCSLYALTWFALDDCGGKLDMSAQSFPRGAYRLKDKLPEIASSNAKSQRLLRQA